MPVDFESYHPNDLPGEGTNGRQIITHLAQHPELGFTPSELADELGIPRGSVGTTLRRLEDRGLVRHKGDYWAINVEAYDAQSASEIGLRAVADQFEGDYYDENPNWDADLPDIDAETNEE
jgi:predicted transcriptional regulator